MEDTTVTLLYSATSSKEWMEHDIELHEHGIEIFGNKHRNWPYRLLTITSEHAQYYLDTYCTWATLTKDIHKFRLVLY